MKEFVGSAALLISIVAAVVLQVLIPPLGPFHDARILLVPMLFCYGALALPFWLVMLFAAFSGYLLDLQFLNVSDGHVEIAVGWSIVYFVFFGLFVHGFEPAFRRGAWWLHPIFSVLGTSLYLAMQFAMISFRRSGFEFNELVLWRVLVPGIMAGLFAPIVHFLVWQGAQFLPAHHRGGHKYWDRA